jgi:hypothetical protein
MAQQQAHVPLTVVLRQETLDAFQEQIQGLPVADWMATRARQWFEGFKDGGIFLNPDQVKKIEEHNGKPVANGADVVAAVGRGNSMSPDGSRTFLLSIDPAFVGPLQVRADEMGRTPDDLINDMFSMAMDNGWAMTLDAAYLPPVYFPNFRLIQTLTGKDRPTGAEIEKAISELVQVAKAAQKQVAETAA